MYAHGLAQKQELLPLMAFSQTDELWESMVYRLGHKGQPNLDSLHIYYSWQDFWKMYQYHKEVLMLARCLKQDEEIPVERTLLWQST